MSDERLTTDDPFERDLRAVLDELAPNEVPPMLRTVLAQTMQRLPDSRERTWLRGRKRLAGAVATVGVLGVAALLVLGTRPTVVPGGSPSPRSSLVAGWVEQIDGIYGYAMLRPTNWTPTGGQFPNGREYVAPGSTPSGDIVIRAVNLLLPAAHPAGPGGSVEWPLFESAPSLSGWTAGLEALMTREGQPFELLRTLPEAKIYALALPNGASGYAFVVAYIVAQGQPLIVSLGATGTDGDLGSLQAQGVVDDFVTMVGSVTAIPADPQHVTPSLPAATGPQPAPTPNIAPSPTAPVVITHVVIDCPAAAGGSPTAPATTAPDPQCPGQVAAVLAAVAHAGYAVASVTILPNGFGCAPFLGAAACPVASTGPAAYATFLGTDLVAAATLAPTGNGSWAATLVAFRVPPAGWQLP